MRYWIVSAIFMLGTAVSGYSQPSVSTAYGHVVWSPDGKLIAFTRMEITNSKPRKMVSDIFVSRPDGTEMRRLTGANGNESFPSFSKDGKTVYFGSGAPGSRDQQIYSIGIDGEGLRLIARAPGRDGAPVVSPRGDKIVFNSERDGGMPQIYVMNIDGTDPKRLTDDDKVAFYNPVWSPDGKKIVYYREIRDNKDQIWTMNADGTDKKLLTNNEGHNFYPSWSADGKRIFFTRMNGEKQELFSIGREGDDLKPAGIETFFARQSPDGRRIAFIGVGEPKMTLNVANTDGSNERVIAK